MKSLIRKSLRHIHPLMSLICYSLFMRGVVYECVKPIDVYIFNHIQFIGIYPYVQSQLSAKHIYLPLFHAVQFSKCHIFLGSKVNGPSSHTLRSVVSQQQIMNVIIFLFILHMSEYIINISKPRRFLF